MLTLVSFLNIIFYIQATYTTLLKLEPVKQFHENELSKMIKGSIFQASGQQTLNSMTPTEGPVNQYKLDVRLSTT